MRPEPCRRPAEDAPPPYFNISPDEALAELEAPVSTADFAGIARACADGREDLIRRGHEAGGGRTLRRFSTWEITRYLIPVAPPHFRRVLRANPTLPQGLSETDGRRQVVHPRRGAAAARAFRRRGQPRQGIPPLPPAGPAGQGRRHRQLQGRRRQDLDRGAPRHVRRARRLPGAGDRPRQPGLDDLGLRRQGRLGVGHRLPAHRARLRPRAAGREPPPRRARRRRPCRSRTPSPRRWRARPRTSSRRPTGPTSTSSAPSSTSTGPSSRSRSGACPCAPGSSGRRSRTRSTATACSTPTTSSSSIPRPPSAISPSTG